MNFDPPLTLTLAFTALTAVVAVTVVVFVRHAAPPEARPRWTWRAAVIVGAWMAVHAAIAESGVLEGNRMPPPVAFYLLPTMAVAVGVASSRIGGYLARLPVSWLVGLMAFRLPLEIILHRLYTSGNLPIQMTWSGYNFDVLTGLSAAILGLVASRRPLPSRLVLGWNAIGSALLLIVVTIAVTSAPTPLRQFSEGPPVVLPFHAPFNWIVNVHVFTALVGHLVVFRALSARREVASHAAA